MTDSGAGSAPAGGFLSALRARARRRGRTLVFPESDDARVLQAVARIAAEELARPVLLGPPDRVHADLDEQGVPAGAVAVLDPRAPERIERYGARLHALRAHRGLGADEARALAGDALLQAALMVRSGEADGSVAGAVRTTGEVVRAALWGVGPAAGIGTVSSAFYMVLPPGHPRGEGVLTFTDAGVVPDPSPRQLAEIAVAACAARRRVVGDVPRVAFLSYSTHGSAEGPAVERVREAVRIFRDLAPGVEADGELQGDAALSPDVGARKAPGSPVAGRANVLVFPDLDAANISYKLTQYLGGLRALGPVLQGLARPCNDLSRGATVDDVVEVACITALLAGHEPESLMGVAGPD